MDHGVEVDLLGGDEREALGEIEPELVSEDGERAGAGTVFLAIAVIEDVPKQLEILHHVPGSKRAV